MRVFAVTILALLSTILLGAALLLGLPWDFAEQALWITILLPILWSILIIYCYWDARKWRVIGVMTSVCAISIVAILTNPPTL